MERISTSFLKRPVLVVSVDCEESYDWKKPVNREEVSIEDIHAISMFHDLCHDHGIHPTYAVDYPVASQVAGVAALKNYFIGAEATLAAHLHPWVTPPFGGGEDSECVEPCVPDQDILTQRRKISTLFGTLEDSFGPHPRVYKASHGGLGESTGELLRDLDVKVDLSVRPPFDFRPSGGQDFSEHPSGPYWHEEPGGLLMLPMTGAFVGWLRQGGDSMFQRASESRTGRLLKLPELLSGSGAVKKLSLSPEGFTARENRLLTQELLDRGQRVFHFGLHSTSLVPGRTPHVRSRHDLVRLLEGCRQYFEFFLGKLDGRALSPLELRETLLDESQENEATAESVLVLEAS